jgi:hypothetical protein
MKLPRRTFLKFAAAAVAAPAFSRLAAAQTYPSRSITMIVPFPPGGTVDVVGRILAERMKGTLGQPIIIEKRQWSQREHRHRARRSRGARWLYDRPRLGGHACVQRRFVLASIRRIE